MHLSSSSDKETQEYGVQLGKKLAKGLICLYGSLGAGKTTFVRGLAKGLGVKSRISSPTFTYQRVHKGRVKLYHFDCYRLEKPDQLLVQELTEALVRNDGVVAVEWAEKIIDFLPQQRLDISLEYKTAECRKITYTSHDGSTSRTSH